MRLLQAFIAVVNQTVLLAALALVSGGCGVLSLTEQGLIRHQVNLHDEAVAKQDWRKAATFYDPRMFWRTSRRTLRGAAGIRGYLQSLQNIRGFNGYHTVVDKIVRVDATHMVTLVHITVSVAYNQMQLDFRRLDWDAKILWVKDDLEWKIGGIEETTPRHWGKR